MEDLNKFIDSSPDLRGLFNNEPGLKNLRESGSVEGIRDVLLGTVILT